MKRCMTRLALIILAAAFLMLSACGSTKSSDTHKLDSVGGVRMTFSVPAGNEDALDDCIEALAYRAKIYGESEAYMDGENIILDIQNVTDVNEISSLVYSNGDLRLYDTDGNDLFDVCISDCISTAGLMKDDAGNLSAEVRLNDHGARWFSDNAGNADVETFVFGMDGHPFATLEGGSKYITGEFEIKNIEDTKDAALIVRMMEGKCFHFDLTLENAEVIEK